MTASTTIKPSLETCRYLRSIYEKDSFESILYDDTGHYLSVNEVGWITHKLYDFYDEDFGFDEFYTFTNVEIGKDLKRFFGLTDQEIKDLWTTQSIRVLKDAILLVLKNYDHALPDEFCTWSKTEKYLSRGIRPQIESIYEEADGYAPIGDSINRFYSINMLSDNWKGALWESFDFDPDEHKDGDDLPWTDEDVEWYKKVSLVTCYNSIYQTDIDYEEVEYWYIGDGDLEEGWFIAPVKKKQ